LRPANDLNGAMLEDNPLFHQFGDMTSAAANAAKDYRSWMLEQMKINMGVALDFASGVASVNSRLAPVAYPGVLQPPKNNCSQGAANATPAAAKIADEYRAKAFDLVTANVRNTLEFTQGLVQAKTPTEFLELSTSHARKQFELIMKQTAELGSFAQRLATPRVE
jgi:hypothetical protein